MLRMDPNAQRKIRDTEAINLVSRNCRNINSNKTDLKYLLNTKEIKIAALSETWVKPDAHCRVGGYNVIRNDRNDGKGGTALLIRQDITFEVIPLNRQNYYFEVTVAKVAAITIVSFYIPPNALLLPSQLTSLTNSLNSSFILCGDINGHSQQWGSHMKNKVSEILENITDQFKLCLLNDGKSTCINPPGQMDSLLDLVFSTPDLAPYTECYTMEDTYGSHHCPVLTRIVHQHTNNVSTSLSAPVRYNIKKAIWNLYTNFCQNNTAVLSDNSASSPTPWWDSECG